MTILLTVIAPKDRPFVGMEILQVAQEMDLKLNKIGLLNHLPSAKSSGDPVFSIAHLREPGIFSLDSVRTLATPGLLFYMQLPGPLDEVAATDVFMASARRFAEKLGGTLCDEKRKMMSPAALIRVRSRVAEFARHRAQSSAQ